MADLTYPQREALAAESLRRSGRLRLQVRGESMLPSLWPGDVAEISACPAGEVRFGDIVLVLREGRLFLHRVQSCSREGALSLRGDSMPHGNVAYDGSDLLGKLTRLERNGCQIPVPNRLRLWSRACGLLLCYCDWARSLALTLHARKIGERGRHENSNLAPGLPDYASE